MRIGSVGAKADNDPFAPVASFFLVQIFHQRGNLLLGDSFPQSGNGLLHHPVIHLGSMDHGLLLFLVLVHPHQIHRRRAVDGHHIAPRFQQIDQKAAGPELIHPQLAGKHPLGQGRGGLVAVTVQYQLRSLLLFHAKEFIGIEHAVFLRNIQHPHPLHGGNPQTGEIIHRSGSRDQDLLQALLRHGLPYSCQTLLIHPCSPFPAP